MYKIYGITQGEREVDISLSLPGVVRGGTKGRVAYYTWCIRDEKTAILVETGLRDAEARKRNVHGAKYLEDRLKKLKVDPTNIEIIVVTHLHCDHFSEYELYKKASFYIQTKDIEFFSGIATRFPQVTHSAANMLDVLGLAYAKRVRYLNGDEQVIPGIRVLLLGGHTPGSQVVVVTTSKGEAVICGDIVDCYRNLEEGVIGHSINLMDNLLAWDKIKAMASSPELIIPGHDPLVMKRFPNPTEGVVEIA